MNKESLLSYRVSELEKKVIDLVEKVDKIMTNEIPHLQEAIADIKGDIKSLSQRVVMGVTINVVTIIGGIVGIILFIK